VHRLQAIVFDVDGTLADTEEVHRLAFNRVFAEHGLDWHWNPEEYCRLLAISGGLERITAYGAALRKRFADAAAFDDFVRDLHRAKTRRYGAMLAEGEVRLRPGIRRLIDEARAAGIVLAIATSSARANCEALLDNNLPPGWRDWFAAIETCDSVPQKKPSPAVYQAVLRGLGLPAAGVIALEDTQNGLRAALAAGLLTVITTHRFTRAHTFPGAALVLDSAGEPAQPFTVLAGDAHGRTLLDLSLIETLLVARERTDASSAPPRLRAIA
jgi:HAD superfamily hydrolase (TIGR01509 family)